MLGAVDNILVVREIDTEDGICKTYERVELKQFVSYYSRRYRSANKFGSGEGNGSPLQYSFLENPMDGGAW